MTPEAAKELLDVVMLDEVVERRRALDTWTRRWIATMHVEASAPSKPSPATYRDMAEFLRRQMLAGLAKDEVHALQWGALIDDPNSLVLQMHVVLQVPHEINSGADAAQRMMDMARGGGK